MNMIRIGERDVLRPLHVVMIFLVSMTLAGGFLLLSAAESSTLVDGAVEWHVESPLRAVVQLLCLNYQLPTINAGEIKGYILGIGAALAVFAVSIAVLTRGPGGEEETGAIESDGDSSSTRRPQIAPLLAVQFLVALYLLWSFASSRWSSAPQLAVGGSILLTIQFLWAFALGVGLSPRAARIVSQMVVLVTAATAAIALWYYFGRNPVLRAKFPFGNPNFLSAALIPGILLAIAFLGERVYKALQTRTLHPVGIATLMLPLIAVSAWAFVLADSRGAAAGLAAGLLALLFFAAPRRWKAVPFLLAVVLAIGGWWYFSSSLDGQFLTGRSETLRFRGYAWSYAWRMFKEKPFTGYGQGGFVLTGDSFAVGDVLNDPLVFESRIDHAHNEWLEVMSDLGSVGIILLAATILITFLTAMAVLRRSPPHNGRWVLLGLLAALVGLIVEETFGVGLRICELPIVFYTVLGLIWALCGSVTTSPLTLLSAKRGRRLIAGPIGIAFGLIVLVINQQDFASARSAYRTEEALQKGEFEEAIRLASQAVDRLYPQRALFNLYRLGEAYVFTADKLQQRASDRERRARESEPANPRLLALAEEDYRAGDEYGKTASHMLKELISRSPGFLNHGQLEFKINLIEARSATVRGDAEASQAYLKNARKAIERELLRQPFDPTIALNFVRVPSTSVDYAEVLNVLARPLRYNRITDAYVEVLRDLARNPEFDRQREPVLSAAREALSGTPPVGPAGEALETWEPEKLRLIATLDFVRGEYERAADALELAAGAYERLPGATSIGAAACNAELADCRFFSDPDHPEEAILRAKSALDLALDSRLGRELKLSIQLRMIHYYLAADDEASAIRLLRESAPAGVTDAAVQQQLGIRLRRLCESLLLQRRNASTLLKLAENLLPKLQHWIQRSIEINPDDYSAHYLAADLAFHAGDDLAAARHLESALQLGLPREDAVRFLEMARAKKPDSSALETLRRAIEAASPEGSDTPPQP
jgi:O-antigen ligase